MKIVWKFNGHCTITSGLIWVYKKKAVHKQLVQRNRHQDLRFWVIDSMRKGRRGKMLHHSLKKSNSMIQRNLIHWLKKGWGAITLESVESILGNCPTWNSVDTRRFRCHGFSFWIRWGKGKAYFSFKKWAQGLVGLENNGNILWKWTGRKGWCCRNRERIVNKKNI